MSNVNVLDCTLRDGAYLIDKKFGNENISGIINGLVSAKVDYIEIGFFQDDGFGDGNTVYKNSAEAARYIPEDKQGCEFTVLADFSRYSIENLDERRMDSIDAVRECFFKHERFDALDVCRKIKNKEYKVFVQPVDILGYSDIELIKFLDKVNEVEPYCLSIVDTFGSMYQEDLHRVFEIINHNLVSTCKIGFHSHNNLQLSSALSQEFIRIASGKRNIIVDGTISGMGRGAGNTPTELIVQYLVSQLQYNYDLDSILDIIDTYMKNIRSQCEWGYTTAGFIAGSYGSHMNNMTYLTMRNGIKSKDIRYIINKIGEPARKRYNYDLLEKTYLEYLSSEIDDSDAINILKDATEEKTIVILVPGASLKSNADVINAYVSKEDAVVMSVNFIDDLFDIDYIYMSNIKRYQYWRNNSKYAECKKIFTSNICSDKDNAIIVSFSRLIKCGWENFDNSTIMLLRLIDELKVKKIAVAGFDGYDPAKVNNYYSQYMEVEDEEISQKPNEKNEEIMSMLKDYVNTRINKNIPIEFITPSRFSRVCEDND